METQATVGMTEATGVIPGADAPTSAAETSPHSEPQGDSPQEETQEEMLSLSKSEYDQRIANLKAEYDRKASKRAASLQQKLDAAKDAIALQEHIKTNPKRYQEFAAWLNGGQPFAQQQPQGDPYAEFDPVVADQFRKIDQLNQKITSYDQFIQNQQQQSTIQYQDNIDKTYASWLQRDGFLKADGAPEDPSLVQVIDNATYNLLQRGGAQDPNHPTEEEVADAYKVVTSGIQYAEKRGLRKAITPTVPLSGSKSGSLPKKSGPRTDEERWAEMAEMI